MSADLGKKGGWVKCPASRTARPPEQGWLCWTGKAWAPELTMRAGPPGPACRTVTLTATGPAAVRRPGFLGVFHLLEGVWSSGRPVGATLHALASTVEWHSSFTQIEPPKERTPSESTNQQPA